MFDRNPTALIQLAFSATLVIVLLVLLFHSVPPDNAQLFNNAFTALISLLSGGALGYTAAKKQPSQVPAEPGQ